MSNNYWSNFYKNPHILQPSAFAEFCLSRFPKNSRIVEFGCGNGRDTLFFANKGYNTTGIDFACKQKQIDNANFIKSDITKYLNSTLNSFDVTYTRFFLHSIKDEAIDLLLKWSKGLFCAEFRAKEDVPILYPDHYRNKIDGRDFLSKMTKNKFEILYYFKGRGVAKFKIENPLIIRIIGKKI